MSTSARPISTDAPEGIGTKLRQFAIGALFAGVLLVPKLLRLRRNPHSWFVFRVALGTLGAALVVLPLSLWNAWAWSIVGLGLFLAAALLPPAQPDTSTDDKARELGALVVVHGGVYQPENHRPVAVRLFVGAERVSALDAGLRTTLVIPNAEIRSVRAAPEESGWSLRIEWANRTAEFSYRGFFAEHLATVAATTLNSALRLRLPVLPSAPESPRSRAAGA